MLLSDGLLVDAAIQLLCFVDGGPSKLMPVVCSVFKPNATASNLFSVTEENPFVEVPDEVIVTVGSQPFITLK